MKIFQAELNDNLGDKLTNNSIAMVCEITNADAIEADKVNLSTAALCDRPVQKDLYYLSSILVSAGWNKNDDVFAVSDLWEAKDTPVDKPFNYMHDDSDIIGHMISSVVLTEEGGMVESLDSLPDKADIATGAVIYRTWSDPERAAEIEKRIEKIQANELAVSMECVFNSFDYAVITPEGGHKVVARDEESAFLTKHLRAYGGTGEYQGYKVGRLLRNLYFTGKGLVDKPANPRSVIFSEPFNPTVSTAMEVGMPDETKLEQELLAEQAKASALVTEIDGHKQTIASLEAKVVELENTIATVSQEKLSLSQEIQKMLAEARTVARKSALLKAGATEEKATELIAKFAEASEDMFESVVALIVTTPVAQPVETETETEVETEALETVVVESPAITIVDDTVSDKIETAAAFLREHVLNSGKKKGVKHGS
jgi:hypothetical protein